MTISTEPSTFEFARDWLVSSECFVRDAMLADAVTLDASRDQARERIHRQEVLQEPEVEDAPAHTPDDPPPVDARPYAIIIPGEDARERVGTGTWSGNGNLLIIIEALVPEAYLANHADDTQETKATKFKSRREWADQLVKTIRDELMETSGRSDGSGNPYLNATNIDIYLAPSDPEEGEPEDYIGWIYEVVWN